MNFFKKLCKITSVTYKGVGGWDGVGGVDGWVNHLASELYIQ